MSDDAFLAALKGEVDAALAPATLVDCGRPSQTADRAAWCAGRSCDGVRSGFPHETPHDLLSEAGEHVWTTRQLARLVPGARVTQPAVPHVYGERVLTVVRLIQDAAYAGGWAVNVRPESAGGVAVAALDPETVQAP